MDSSNQAAVRFSERERTILRLMADGLSNQEIADHLFLALTTVKWYVRQINEKLDTHTRTRTLARARQLKLIPDELINAHSAELLDRQSKKISRESNDLYFVERKAVSHLPIQVTSFVGRLEELSHVTDLLSDPDCRLLNLVGAGGIGKTRLALRAASDQVPFYADGVYFVALQSVATADLIPSAMANALDIRFFDAEDPRVKIIKWLRDKHVLLLMDNFEHLLGATDLLTEILATAPDIKILTTSRERLNMQEEWTLFLEGLSFPDSDITISFETFSAIQLFVERAKRVQSTFSLTSNAEAVKVICQQVEGMPLAIELAASWLRVMTCQQISVQVARNISFLTTPLRNVLERHRSIQAVFEQSWILLSSNEQNVLMQLSVFRGGFDLEAAEAVAGASLIVLVSLADKSLVRVSATGRYDLHELLRQFTAHKLTESGGADAAFRRHLDYFIHLAEDMEADLFSPRQTAWLERMRTENDNLRAALAYALHSEEAELGLRLAGALGWFWHILCYWTEGCDWLEKLLAIGEDVSPSIRAYALYHAGDLACLMGDGNHAALRLTQALELARKTGNKRNIAWTLSAQGYLFGKPALEGLKEALGLFREMNDHWGTFHALIRSAITQADNLNNYMMLYSTALALAREAEATVNIAWAQLYVAVGNYIQGETRRTRHMLEDSLSRFRQVNDRMGTSWTLVWVGIVEEEREDYEQAQAAFNEAITIDLEIGNTSTKAFCVSISGPLLIHKLGNRMWVARLLAATETLIGWIFQYIYDKHVAALRSELGDAAFEKAWAEGKALSIEQAVAYAFGEEPLPDETFQPSHHQPLIEPLTERERDVLRLMGQGLSNPQIAERLIVAIGTVKAHTNSIFGKLSVTNRVQAVNRAKELQLL